MKKNKKIILALSSLLIVTTVSIGIIDRVRESKSLEQIPSKKDMLAIYIEDDSGEYSLSNSSKFPTDGYVLDKERSFCKNGGELSQDKTTKSVSLSVSNKDQCTVYFKKERNIVNEIIASSKGVRTDFNSLATTNEGVFEMADDYGTSYYFRGAVTNNYVKFGRNKVDSDMYWRIIRVNGDGSLRMIYDGTSAHANGESSEDRFALTSVAWNTTNCEDAKYVGYMYGGANGTASTTKEEAQTNQTNTNIKTQVDAWYKENIVDTGYSKYVSDEIFCNDRSTPGSSVSNWTNDTGLGYAKNVTAYGAGARFITGNNGTSFTSRRGNPSPKFTCSQKNDAFTVSDTTKGNWSLTYPVGLITADEVIASGGRWGAENRNYYLYKGTWYWTLSPCYFSGVGSRVFVVYNGGNMDLTYVYNVSGDVAPVINLSAEYSATLEGDGTITSPYILP